MPAVLSVRFHPISQSFTLFLSISGHQTQPWEVNVESARSFLPLATWCRTHIVPHLHLGRKWAALPTHLPMSCLLYIRPFFFTHYEKKSIFSHSHLVFSHVAWVPGRIMVSIPMCDCWSGSRNRHVRIHSLCAWHLQSIFGHYNPSVESASQKVSFKLKYCRFYTPNKMKLQSNQ